MMSSPRRPPLELLGLLLVNLNPSSSFVFRHHHTTPIALTSTNGGRNEFLLRRPRHNRVGETSLHMNLLTDIGDMMTGGKLTPQDPSELPYSPPLCSCHSICTEEPTRCFAVKERGISFTGEDFDVYSAETSEPVVRVRGAMLHLPGKDKMKLCSRDGDGGQYRETAVLDRKLVSMTPTYDIYRGRGGGKVGWLEKEAVALTDTFNVYMEGRGGVGPFRPPPSYRISGDFVDRNFVMKNDKGEVVAKVCMDGLFQFDAFNHYQVQVAPGMDALLVIACACAIDEEFDEEHEAARKK